MSKNLPSLRAQAALRQMGADLKMARRKRRIPIEDFALRVGVSSRTIIRLEKGDSGVSIGTLAMACLTLVEIGRIDRLIDPATDDTGLLLDRDRLPKRISRERNPSRPRQPAHQTTSSGETPGDTGVGF